jgi:hypothetical protein
VKPTPPVGKEIQVQSNPSAKEIRCGATGAGFERRKVLPNARLTVCKGIILNRNLRYPYADDMQQRLRPRIKRRRGADELGIIFGLIYLSTLAVHNKGGTNSQCLRFNVGFEGDGFWLLQNLRGN